MVPTAEDLVIYNSMYILKEYRLEVVLIEKNLNSVKKKLGTR